MVRELFWTETAKKSLKLIYDFYKEKVSSTTADKIKNKIMDDAKALQTGNFTTAIEPVLSDFDFEYRFLVSGNYKIVYLIDNNVTVISLVFDSRQNPNKLYSILKNENPMQ